MNDLESPTDDPVPDPLQAILGELRDRLGSANAQKSAVRTEARRLARELALTRRLLRFYLGDLPPARPSDATLDDGTTVLLSEPLVYHLDAREDFGTHTAISGWAFRPAPGWDARATRIILLLRHDDTVYMTPCRAVRRPDVAAFYAGQPPEASVGAVGLDGVGFACEVQHEALPAGTDWKIILRLECDGQACEQFTGQTLRL